MIAETVRYRAEQETESMNHHQSSPNNANPTGTVGVVIVSYNTASLLCDCLHSLQTSTLPLRVVVVDNASSDDSVARVRRTFPDVLLHPLDDNRGFAAATNVGLRLLGFGGGQASASDRETDTTHALLLNPDTRLHPGALEHLAAFLYDHPRVGVVAPRLLNPDGSVQAAAFRFPTLMMSVLDMFPPGEVLPGRLAHSWWNGRYPQEQTSDISTSDTPAPFPIDHPLGACMLVRGRTIAEAGLLDERYFMYSEEIDWCWRIRQAGWAIWQQPRARVTHVGGASTQQFRHRMLIALHRSRVQFFRQHAPPHVLHVHRAIVGAGMLRAMLRTWSAYARHTINRDELRRRIWAYGEVLRTLSAQKEQKRVA